MRFVFWIVFGLLIGFAMSRFNRRGSNWISMLLGIAGAIGGGIAVHQLGWGREEDLPWTLVGAIAGAVVLSFIYRWITAVRAKSQRAKSDDTHVRKVA